MTHLDVVLTDIGNWVLYVATLVMTALVIYYHLTARWWKTAEGRHVMAWTFVTATILLFLTTAVSGTLSTDGKIWVRMAIYAQFVWLGLWRFRLISRAQRRVMDRHDADNLAATEAAADAARPPSEVPPFHTDEIISPRLRKDS